MSKEGKMCAFRLWHNKDTGEWRPHVCNSNCGLYNEGFKACVFHSLNANVADLVKTLRSVGKVVDER